MNEVELKKKVTLKRKGNSADPISPQKKPKLWLWLLLIGAIIVVVLFVVKNNSTDKTDKNLIAKTEQAANNAFEIIADVQNGSFDFEEVKAKIEDAQKTIDEAKIASRTDEEIQAVANAQAKVNEALSAVENSNQATQTVETINESIADEEVVSPAESYKTPAPAQTPNEKPTTKVPNGSNPDSDKTIARENATPMKNVTTVSIEQKAKDVIRGNYGNGADRKQALGSEYEAIQSKVNEMYRNGEVR